MVARPSQSDTVAVALLSVALLSLMVVLRSAQPGLLTVSPLPTVAGIGVVYVLAAVLLVRRPAAMALAFGLMVAAHLLYGLITGLLFATLDDGIQPGPTPPLGLAWLGLFSYPPATALQAALALTLAAVVMRPEPRHADLARALREAGVETSGSPLELLRAVLSATQSVTGDEAAELLASAARRVLSPGAPQSCGPITLQPARDAAGPAVGSATGPGTHAPDAVAAQPPRAPEPPPEPRVQPPPAAEAADAQAAGDGEIAGERRGDEA